MVSDFSPFRVRRLPTDLRDGMKTMMNSHSIHALFNPEMSMINSQKSSLHWSSELIKAFLQRFYIVEMLQVMRITTLFCCACCMHCCH